MWQTDGDGWYLEPGEIAVLAAVAARAVPSGPSQHPNDIMLQALSDALQGMVAGSGVVVVPAPSVVVQQAGRAYVRQCTAVPAALSGGKATCPA